MVRDTKLYAVELLNCYGNRVVVKAFGVEKVSEVRNIVDLDGMKGNFSQEVQDQWGKLSRYPQGNVHLLVGQEMAPFHPIAYKAHKDLLVCRSMFGSGWLPTGTDESVEEEHKCWGEEVAAMRLGRIQASHGCAKTSYQTLNPTFSFTQDRDYYTLEGLGVEPAHRCQNCKGCKECSWRGQELSQKEAFELGYMEKCVELIEGRFRIAYPFLVDPAELPDNYNQVVRIAKREEFLLLRDGWMNVFNDLLMELLAGGYTEELSREEEKA